MNSAAFGFICSLIVISSMCVYAETDMEESTVGGSEEYQQGFNTLSEERYAGIEECKQDKNMTDYAEEFKEIVGSWNNATKEKFVEKYSDLRQVYFETVGNWTVICEYIIAINVTATTENPMGHTFVKDAQSDETGIENAENASEEYEDYNADIHDEEYDVPLWERPLMTKEESRQLAEDLNVDLPHEESKARDWAGALKEPILDVLQRLLAAARSFDVETTTAETPSQQQDAQGPAKNVMPDGAKSSTHDNS